MPYKLLISDSANNDVDHAIGYVAIALAAPLAAASLLDAYESALKRIAENPLLFPEDVFVSEAVARLVRRAPVKRYGIYYTIDEQNSTVYVLAFTHGRRDTVTLISERYT